MRTVYLEPVTFECHTVQNEEGARIPYETEFFDGKCDTFVEGFRIKPDGERWVRSDGEVFEGPEMISPWNHYDELEAAQKQYEADMAELEAAYQEGVNSAYG